MSQVTRLGEQVDPLALEGLVAEEDGLPIGLATVQETAERGLEVVTLHAEPAGRGAGTALLETAFQVAVASGHRRLWLVTPGDSLLAIHFFLRRGMRVAAVHSEAVELELRTDVAQRDELVALPRISFPSMEDLDQLPVAAFAHELAPLFEGASGFLNRLAAERPFASDSALIDAAFEVGRQLTEGEAVELVEAHPRIGAPPASVSQLSYAEQGYATEQADHETARVYEELSMLNEIYEQRFGFRYVVFVAGRPKVAIVPLVEAALRNDRQVELRRAVADTVYIAADRLATLRG